MKFSFYATGINSKSKKNKLDVFVESLKEYGSKETSKPENWFRAFSRLKDVLESPDCFRDPKTGKEIVFLDELLWMHFGEFKCYAVLI